MPDVNISLKMSGIIAFFGLLCVLGTTAGVTFVTTGHLTVFDFLRGVVPLYIFTSMVVIFIYIAESES